MLAIGKADEAIIYPWASKWAGHLQRIATLQPPPPPAIIRKGERSVPGTQNAGAALRVDPPMLSPRS
jgi:hypothetical protein